jgi:transcriptional regulator with XRE-family HTH domain
MRIDNNLTVRQLSERAYISYGHLSDVERGVKAISPDLLEEISNGLDLSVPDLLREVADYMEMA